MLEIRKKVLMMCDEWFEADDKTKETAIAIFEFIQQQKLSLEQFHVMMKILPDKVYEKTIIQENA